MSKAQPTLLAMLVAACGGSETEVSASADVAPPAHWDEGEAPEPAPETRQGRRARAVELGQARRSGPPTATYPGFQTFDDGTSRVFIEIVGGEVPMKKKRTDGVLRFRFPGVRVPGEVNRMPLPTTHFDTPVSLVRVEEKGDDAVLVIQLRHVVEPEVHLEASEAGTVLSVDFPLRGNQPDEGPEPTGRRRPPP